MRMNLLATAAMTTACNRAYLASRDVQASKDMQEVDMAGDAGAQDVHASEADTEVCLDDYWEVENSLIMRKLDADIRDAISPISSEDEHIEHDEDDYFVGRRPKRSKEVDMADYVPGSLIAALQVATKSYKSTMSTGSNDYIDVDAVQT